MLRTSIALLLLVSTASVAEEVRRDLYGDPLPAGASIRLGTVCFRHGAGAIHCLAYSPDGRQLASGGEDLLIRLRDARTGAELLRLAGHRAAVRALSFSPDGKMLASAGGEDRTVRLWDAATGRLLRRLEHDTEASSLAFFPDGKSLVTSDGSKKRIHFWAVTSGKCLRTLDAGEEGVDNLSLSPNGKWLATGSQRIRLLDVASGKTVRVLKTVHELEEDLSGLAFTPDGEKLAASTYVGRISLWDLKTGELVRRVKTPRSFLTTEEMNVIRQELVFTPDSRTLISADGDGMIYRWEVSTAKEPQLLGRSSSAVYSLSLTPDGKTLASAGENNVIRLWDLTAGKRLIIAKGHEGGIDKLRFAAEDKTLLSSGYDETARSWDLATGAELNSEVFFQGYSFARMCVDPSLEHRIVAVWMKRTVRLRDLATKKVLAAFETAADVQTLSFSRDGKVLAIATEDREVEIWDVRTHTRRCRVPGNIYPTVLSDDGRWIVTDLEPLASHWGGLYLWDAVSGEEIAHISAPDERTYLYPRCFSPDNRMLSFWEWRKDNHALVIWEVGTGRQRFRLDGHNGMDAVSFSPDGRLLAFSGGDGAIGVLDLPTGKERARFRGGQGQVYTLAFSNSGRLLASGGRDTTILLWPLPSTRTTQPVRELSAEELRALWTDLAGEDGARAFRAMRQLYAAPSVTFEMLCAHLRPVDIPDAWRVKRLLADLDADDFTAREEASRQLNQVAEGAESLLRQALSEEPSLEARRRIKRLLEPLAAQSPERWRTARALEVLEWLNTRESHVLLDQLAHGASDAWLTREAKASPHRLDRQPRKNNLIGDN